MGKIHVRRLSVVEFDEGDARRVAGIFDAFDQIRELAPRTRAEQLHEAVVVDAKNDFDLRLKIGDDINTLSVTERTTNGAFFGSFEDDAHTLSFLQLDPNEFALDSNAAAFKIGTTVGYGALEVHYYDPKDGGSANEAELYSSAAYTIT